MTMTIEEAIERLKESGFTFGECILELHVQDASKQMLETMRHFIPNPVWLPEYNEVSSWLSDNKGRGLLLIGAPGLGKTLLATKVLPVIVLRNAGKVMHYVSARDINFREKEITNTRILVIDDVGVEDTKNDYGERRNVFADTVDRAERRGDTLILTTNLTPEELERKYQQRTLDRLRAVTQWVILSGHSFRK